MLGGFGGEVLGHLGGRYTVNVELVEAGEDDGGYILITRKQPMRKDAAGASARFATKSLDPDLDALWDIGPAFI